MPGTRHTFEDGWALWSNADDAGNAAHQATVHALANGLLGVRGSIEERDRDHASILPTAVLQRPITYHEKFPGFAAATDTRLLGPGVTGIDIAVDGEALDFAAAEPRGFHRWLCLKTATLHRETEWHLPDGRQLRVTSKRVVPICDAPLCWTTISVQPLNFSGQVEVAFPIAMESFAIGSHDDPRINARAGFAAAQAKVTSSAKVTRFVAGEAQTAELFAAQALLCAGPGIAGHRIDHGAVSASLAPGQSVTIDRLVALGLNEPDAVGALQRAARAGCAAIARAHQLALADWWQQASVIVAGDAQLTAAIRFNLLQLFMSSSRSPEVGVAAKGLTGEGYEGHYFWDTEVFVLPVLALTQPRLARTIIEYRVGRLEQARANARGLGHGRGALFPWRTIRGKECSAHYPTGAAQYHVNAAIAFGIETYLQVTGDRSILPTVAELLVETARLWIEVGHFCERRGGSFLIHSVTGPDEYTALVDNDFYTNAMARRHLNFAAKVLADLKVEHPARLAALVETLGIAGHEPAQWQDAARRMWLPIDPATGVFPQDDTFMDKPAFAGLQDPALRRPLLLSLHPMLLYRHRLCKQGDVIQAHQVSGVEASLAQLQRDYEYYEPLTTHDSTLSMTAFGIAAARLGKDSAALKFHRDTALVDLEDLHGNTSHGAHMAALAGSWLLLAQGWAGLRIDGDLPELSPRCPAQWDEYSFRFQWRGSLLEVRIQKDAATYRLIKGSALILRDHGREVTVRPAPSRIDRPKVEAVIFDLDGVLTNTAEAHYAAWKRLCDERDIPFDREFNERLKGIDRRASLELILAQANLRVDEAELCAMLDRKNGFYLDQIATCSPADLFPGVQALLRSCQRAGLKIGLASASRNAPQLIGSLGIAHYFDFVADPAALSAGKPDPEIFLTVAAALATPPESCVGIEDAQAGIAAIRSAGMTAIGVGDPEILSAAHQVFAETGLISLSSIHAAGCDKNKKSRCFS